MDTCDTRTRITISLFVLLLASAAHLQAQERREPVPGNPANLLSVGANQTEPLKINDSIFQAIGFGNTFMVVTPAGDVIIDTSLVVNAPRHKKLLQQASKGPIKYIILTHGHGDHTGGVPTWKEEGTQIIAQRNHIEFMNYQTRLAGFFAHRNAAQFGRPVGAPGGGSPGNRVAKIEPTILFDEKYEFELGGVKFEIFHTPGETPDHLTVWIPQFKAAFTGDNFYDSFPNMYTLRGTEPRWPLDYVDSLNKVMELKPEVVMPSHGLPLKGNAEITQRLTQYRDAILYVHDATVKGMNDGKDAFTLMREIKLPPNLEVGESYGNLIWSIRGIYEGYAGWFDGNPANMYEIPAASVYPDIVKLAGGPDAVARVAMEKVKAGKPVEGLHLADMSLAAAPSHQGALEARLAGFKALREHCKNSNERGWLDYGIRDAEAKLVKK